MVITVMEIEAVSDSGLKCLFNKVISSSNGRTAKDMQFNSVAGGREGWTEKAMQTSYRS
jgi:hypothetical protein